MVSVGVPQTSLHKLTELTLQASVRYSRPHTAGGNSSVCSGPSSPPPKASEPGGTHEQSLRSGPRQREHIPTRPNKDSVPPRGDAGGWGSKVTYYLATVSYFFILVTGLLSENEAWTSYFLVILLIKSIVVVLSQPSD